MKKKVKIGYYIDVHEFQGASPRGYPKYAGDDTKAAKTLFEKEFDKYNTRLRKGNLIVQQSNCTTDPRRVRFQRAKNGFGRAVRDQEMSQGK